MRLTDEDRERIQAYLDACEQSRDFQRFAHLAWAGPNVTQRDVERWIRAYHRWDQRVAAQIRRVCAVCGQRPRGDYMARDDVWAAAGFDRRDLACFACFVARLGRRPTLDDFTDVPINGSIRLLLRKDSECTP